MYIHKVDKIYIEVRIRNRSYDDKKGMRRFVTEIYADNLEWLSTHSKVENTGEESSVGNSVASSDNSNLPF